MKNVVKSSTTQCLMLILEVVAWIKPGLEESLRHLAPLRRPKKKKLFSFGFFAEVPKLIPKSNTSSGSPEKGCLARSKFGSGPLITDCHIPRPSSMVLGGWRCPTHFP